MCNKMRCPGPASCPPQELLYDCWHLDWRDKPIGQEPCVRTTATKARADDLMHEALRGCYSSAVREGDSWFFYSNQRGLVGVMTPKR